MNKLTKPNIKDIRRDNATGLDYMRFRWYANDLSSFISADRVRGTNRYAYAKGNPVKYVDPMGLKESIIEFSSEFYNYLRRREQEEYIRENGLNLNDIEYIINRKYKLIYKRSHLKNINCAQFAINGLKIDKIKSTDELTYELIDKRKYTFISKDQCKSGAIIASRWGDANRNYGHFAPVAVFYNISTGKVEKKVVFLDGKSGVYYTDLYTYINDEIGYTPIFQPNKINNHAIIDTLIELQQGGVFGPDLILIQ